MDEFRYIRQIGILGTHGQQILVDTKVLCIGIGGLGTLVSSFLTSAGVKQIGLMDEDTVEINNLPRQLSYTEKDCGYSKVQVLKNYLYQRSSKCHIDIYDYHLQAGNPEAIVEKYDLILDCTDNFPAKYLISDICCLNSKPLISAGIDGFCGQVLTLMPDMCYRCVFPAAAKGTSCMNNAIIGPAVGIIASIQANEAIKLVTGLNKANQLIQVDTLYNTMNRFELFSDLACINKHEDELLSRYDSFINFLAWEEILKLAAKESIAIIDIRKDQTQSLRAKNIKSSYESILQLNLAQYKKIVVVCNSGQKSKLAALKLAAKNQQKIFYTKLVG